MNVEYDKVSLENPRKPWSGRKAHCNDAAQFLLFMESAVRYDEH